MDSELSKNINSATGQASSSSTQSDIPHMNAKHYKAAAIGSIEDFMDLEESLDSLLTPKKNTILHIHITALLKERKKPDLSKGVKINIMLFSILQQLLHHRDSNIPPPNSEKERPPNFVEVVLKKCPSLLEKANDKGETPLHLAARYGHQGIVQTLIDQAKPEASNQDVEKGFGPARRMLRMTTKENETALHEAVRYNHIEVVRILTKEDPEFAHSANKHGETPLYMAAERGYFEVVKEILKTCKSLTYEGPNGRTALHAAVYCENEEMTKTIRDEILEKKGIDLTKEGDHQGWIPLHYAAHFGYLSIVKSLLKFTESTAYISENKGKTALLIAAYRGQLEVVKELISSCPDCCELVDQRGWNVLHFAIENRASDAVQYLHNNLWLSNLLNERDAKGNTPLHRFAEFLSYETNFIHNPRVDRMAFNEENLNAMDIGKDNNDFPDQKKSVMRHFKKAGLRRGWKKAMKDDKDNDDEKCEEKDVGGKGKEECDDIYQKREESEKPSKDKDKKKEGLKLGEKTSNDNDGKKAKKDGGEDIVKQMEKAKDAHLVVAALIATVTFTAGFSLPGGYNEDEGPEQGRAILTRNTAFQAFIIADTIAMVFSSSAVFMHLFMALQQDRTRLFRHFIWAFSLTILATGAMVAAFVTGTYAALEHSAPLAISTCLLSSSFFLYYFYFFIE